MHKERKPHNKKAIRQAVQVGDTNKNNVQMPVTVTTEESYNAEAAKIVGAWLRDAAVAPLLNYIGGCTHPGTVTRIADVEDLPLYSVSRTPYDGDAFAAWCADQGAIPSTVYWCIAQLIRGACDKKSRLTLSKSLVGVTVALNSADEMLQHDGSYHSRTLYDGSMSYLDIECEHDRPMHLCVLMTTLDDVVVRNRVPSTTRADGGFFSRLGITARRPQDSALSTASIMTHVPGTKRCADLVVHFMCISLPAVYTWWFTTQARVSKWSGMPCRCRTGAVRRALKMYKGSSVWDGAQVYYPLANDGFVAFFRSRVFQALAAEYRRVERFFMYSRPAANVASDASTGFPYSMRSDIKRRDDYIRAAFILAADQLNMAYRFTMQVSMLLDGIDHHFRDLAGDAFWMVTESVFGELKELRCTKTVLSCRCYLDNHVTLNTEQKEV